MKIVRELTASQCNVLQDKYRNHDLFCSHIKPVINSLHCCLVEIRAQDYSHILIHSGIDELLYRPLSHAVAYINVNPDFLEQCIHGVLCGMQVQHYCDELGSCQDTLQACFGKLDDCFVWDKSGENEASRNEVTDGMHRLVAYGLVSKLNEAHFPIFVIWGTNKPI